MDTWDEADRTQILRSAFKLTDGIESFTDVVVITISEGGMPTLTFGSKNGDNADLLVGLLERVKHDVLNRELMLRNMDLFDGMDEEGDDDAD